MMEALSQQWAAQSIWEIVAVLLALAYVWLAAKQHIACWPSAFISTGIYTWIFWEHSLPMQSLLNFYYLLMAVYGWWHWQSMAEEDTAQVIHKGWRFHGVAIGSCTLICLLVVWLLQDSFNQKYLYLDAFITVFSLFTTRLVTQKVLENWLYWIVINFLSAYLCWVTELYLSSLLMLGYFGFAVYGYMQWRSDSDWVTEP